MLGFPRPGKGFAHERDTILRAIRESRIDNVAVLSGDVHHAEIIRHEPRPGFVFHEFIASPLSARAGFPIFLDRTMNSKSLGSLGWTNNFGEIVAEADRLTVRILDTTGATRTAYRVPAAPRRRGARFASI